MQDVLSAAAPTTPAPVLGTVAQYSKRGRRTCTLLVAALGALAGAGPAHAAASPGATLRQYLEARWRGDVAGAQSLWDPDDLSRCDALGTRYPTLEARFDDNLLQSAEERQALATLARPVVGESLVDSAWARFTVVLEPRADGGAARRDTLYYHLRRTAGSWLLTSPCRQLTSKWTARQGRFFKLRASKLRTLNDDALVSLDAGILAALDRLGTPDLVRVRLERLKIEYYLCADDAEVRALTGGTARSRYLLAGERIVTRSLPDLNAVARALVHLTLHEAPPRSVPFLEEGLAAALGGGASVSGEVLVQRGRVALGQGRLGLDALLDGRPLRGERSDEALAAAGACCAALLHGLGPARFLELYRAQSGSAAQVEARPAAEVRRALEEATAARGPGLAAWVNSRIGALEPPLAGGCAQVPVETAERQSLVRWRDGGEHWQLRAFETGDWYTFVISPYDGPLPAWARRLADSLAAASGAKRPPSAPEKHERPAGDPPRIALILRPRGQPAAEAFESRMYNEHFASRPYHGELYGLFVGPDAARLYDYRLEQLVGCQAKECTAPGGPTYYEVGAGRVCFRLRRSLLRDPITDYMIVTIPYTGE